MVAKYAIFEWSIKCYKIAESTGGSQSILSMDYSLESYFITIEKGTNNENKRFF